MCSKLILAQACFFAHFDLGVLYDTGLGAMKNTALANEWYLKAANNGNTQATKLVAGPVG